MDDSKEKAREQARKAAEQAEKNRRRQELQIKADKVRGKISKANTLISSFRSKQSEFDQAISQMEQKKNSALSSQIVSQVRVSKVFEGVIAEKQASQLPKGIKALDKNIKKTQKVAEGIDDQIRELTTYQDTQQDILSNIMAQIASI
ncbi:hypothetical protein [Enterococcus wangshanyuanii]|uniref:DUF5082 domain-containing protein n=1 Tax=Enterococcus wangshanyuanii TaxID=2005703 RepID=A0ABQ1PFC6_9ENTE|nr:hypothetical protein [Enterococcus wangshanyuanii]GGC96075.1 hypothetical protein GCM10011573_27150 [Enterococcus wangshanyuanii]